MRILLKAIHLVLIYRTISFTSIYKAATISEIHFSYKNTESTPKILLYGSWIHLYASCVMCFTSKFASYRSHGKTSRFFWMKDSEVIDKL